MNMEPLDRGVTLNLLTGTTGPHPLYEYLFHHRNLPNTCPSFACNRERALQSFATKSMNHLNLTRIAEVKAPRSIARCSLILPAPRLHHFQAPSWPRDLSSRTRPVVHCATVRLRLREMPLSLYRQQAIRGITLRPNTMGPSGSTTTLGAILEKGHTLRQPQRISMIVKEVIPKGQWTHLHQLRWQQAQMLLPSNQLEVTTQIVGMS